MSHRSKAAEFIGEGYNITVTGRNVEVTESMKNYAIEKISKIERFVDRIIDVTIVMDIQRFEQRVDLTLKFNNIKIKSHAVSDDMYASIDQAAHRLERQLLKYKARIRDHHAKNLATVDMNVQVLAAPGDKDVFSEEIESENHRIQIESFAIAQIIDKEKRPLRTLNTNEAMMKIELSGDQFLIFRSEEDRKLKVIYRRDDGNYGVIEVEA